MGISSRPENRILSSQFPGKNFPFYDGAYFREQANPCTPRRVLIRGLQSACINHPDSLVINDRVHVERVRREHVEKRALILHVQMHGDLQRELQIARAM